MELFKRGEREGEADKEKGNTKTLPLRAASD